MNAAIGNDMRVGENKRDREQLAMVFLITAELFLLSTIVGSFIKKPFKEASGDVLLCLFIGGLLTAPWIFERWWKVYLPQRLKCLFMMLILGGPILGKIYRLYYKISFWDKMLHMTSGFLFATIGGVLPSVIEKGKQHSFGLQLACAVMFTLSVAVVWEFYEYSMDRFFGMDMQQDTIVKDINSYLLGSMNGAEKGVISSISGINSVVINGVPMEINGYLDIGLNDTMGDMLICSLGGIIYCTFAVLEHEGVALFRRFSTLLPVYTGNRYAGEECTNQ